VNLTGRRVLRCQDAVALITAYLDGALPRRDRVRLERHLRDCANCTEHLRQVRALISTTGQVDESDLSPHALADLQDVFRRWRAEAAAPDDHAPAWPGDGAAPDGSGAAT